MHPNCAKLHFWGVRGSIPTLDRGMWRYGGNTPCLDLIAPDGTRFVLDCGTGLRTLGNQWANMEGDRPIQAHIFVTHYHWDHIQGVPFFPAVLYAAERFSFLQLPIEISGA